MMFLTYALYVLFFWELVKALKSNIIAFFEENPTLSKINFISIKIN